MTLLGPLNFPLVQEEKGSKMELRSLDLHGFCRFSPITQAGDSASMYRGDQQDWAHLVGPELSTTEARHWRDGPETLVLYSDWKQHLWKDLVKVPCTCSWWQMNLVCIDQPPLTASLRLYDHVLDIQERWEGLQTRTGWMNVTGTRRWSEQLCKTQSPEKACWDLQDTESDIYHKESFLRALVVSLNVDSSCFW